MPPGVCRPAGADPRGRAAVDDDAVVEAPHPGQQGARGGAGRGGAGPRRRGRALGRTRASALACVTCTRPPHAPAGPHTHRHARQARTLHNDEGAQPLCAHVHTHACPCAGVRGAPPGGRAGEGACAPRVPCGARPSDRARRDHAHRGRPRGGAQPGAWAGRAAGLAAGGAQAGGPAGMALLVFLL